MENPQHGDHHRYVMRPYACAAHQNDSSIAMQNSAVCRALKIALTFRRSRKHWNYRVFFTPMTFGTALA